MGEAEGWTATSVGSLPGTDRHDAVALVAGESPWPTVPELPARGAGADLVGRTMGLLVEVSGDLAVATDPAGWRRVAAPGRDMRRAATLLRGDLDAVAERFDGTVGPLTVAVAGPWTLAASVVDERGERVLRDRGFVADLAAGHAEAVALLVGRCRRAVPGAQWHVQLDEPSLTAVHRGQVPFSSGYRRHTSVDVPALVAGLRGSVVAARAAGAAVGLHSCAQPLWPVVAGLAPDWFGLDARLLVEADVPALGSWLESGGRLTWGVWPAAGAARSDEADRAVRTVLGWLDRVGHAPSTMPGAVAPTCGMAGATPAQVRAAFTGLRAVAGRLGEIA
jgi:hypothetical protein